MAGFRGIPLSHLLVSALYFVLLILAMAVCGLYGQDLHNAASQGKYMDSKWVYAVVCGGIAGATSVVYFVIYIHRKTVFVWAWNLVVFAFWIILFGIFGNMYIHENPEGDSGVQRMKNAVWVDLANALGWLLMASFEFVYWQTHKRDGKFYT